MEGVESRTERLGGVTFVQVKLTNTQRTPQRICFESQLEGPTWPPRDGSVTAPEWNGDQWEGAIPPGVTRGVGFASPAPPVDPPIRVLQAERAASDEAISDAEVIADLPEWSPPSELMGWDE